MTPTDERLAELKRHHKERAIYFEQMSDGGRLVETLEASKPHWELVDILRELQSRRAAETGCVLVPKIETSEMLAAGRNSMPYVRITDDLCSYIYRAMLASRPMT